MNQEEFERLHAVDPADIEPLVSAAECGAGRAGPRTLAYGYTAERDTWHAYVADDVLHVVTYWNRSSDDGARPLLRSHLFGRALPVSKLVPDKRLYPEATSEVFARMLLTRGVRPPFTSFGHWTRSDTAARLAGMLAEQCDVDEATQVVEFRRTPPSAPAEVVELRHSDGRSLQVADPAEVMRLWGYGWRRAGKMTDVVSDAVPEGSFYEGELAECHYDGHKIVFTEGQWRHLATAKAGCGQFRHLNTPPSGSELCATPRLDGR